MRRTFTDEEFKTFFKHRKVTSKTVGVATEKFHCTRKTVYFYLALYYSHRLHPPCRRRRLFTEEEDNILRLQSRGEIRLYTAVLLLKTSQNAVLLRMSELGLKRGIVPKTVKLPPAKVAQRRAIAKARPIAVPLPVNQDLLLERLKQVHSERVSG